MSPGEKIVEIKLRADANRPMPWGEHDLMREVEWFRKDAIPFLLAQYGQLLDFCAKQCGDVHDLGCQVDGLKKTVNDIELTPDMTIGEWIVRNRERRRMQGPGKDREG